MAQNPDIFAHKGRAAVSADISERFNLPQRTRDGDWRDMTALVDGPEAPVRTTVTEEFPKTILSFNRSPDIPFDRSVNAYRGCEHGCIYCFARPTHAFHDLSPGLDFETRLFAKPEASALLRKTLAKPDYVPQVLALGTNTDPYQPIEGRYRITRGILKLMVETRHPVIITTKSDRVVRDIDLLTVLASLRLTGVTISITTLDPEIARLMEPRAPGPRKRIQAIESLSAKGIPTFVNIAPIVPGITDNEIEAIAEAAANAGAHNISHIPLRLPHEVAPLFEQWLDLHFPKRAAKVMSIVRQLRGGRRNDPAFHSRMYGQGPWADLLRRRVELARKRHGMGKTKPTTRTDLFVRPNADNTQLKLF